MRFLIFTRKPGGIMECWLDKDGAHFEQAQKSNTLTQIAWNVDPPRHETFPVDMRASVEGDVYHYYAGELVKRGET